MNRFKKLYESKLSRVWQHITDPKSVFGVVSAERSEYRKDSKVRTLQLKKIIIDKGYGFIELKGGFNETVSDKNGNETKITVEENSFFIPKIIKKDLIEMATRFEQDTVLYKDTNGFYEIDTKNNIGKVLTKFKTTGENVISTTSDIIKDFFSKLKKGSHKNKKFVFSTLKENQRIKRYKNGAMGYEDNWITIIE